MAEQAEKQETKSLGWLKGALGAIAGLMSGAAMMYLSPLVDRVVKPPRPLANFGVETDGLTATFHNRFAGEGWWDFGDGSPLEPALPQDPTTSHTYPKAGTYSAKLMVRNFIGDEHERSVGLDVTVTNSSAAPPTISSLEVLPLGSDRSAPATFRLLAQTANAERCLLDLGPDRQPEVIADSTAKIERMVTFSSPGDHLVQFTVINGAQALKRTVTVHVEAQRPDVLVAHLHVTDRGTRAEKRTSVESIPSGMTTQSSGTVKINRQIAARNGFTITVAKLGALDPAYRNMKAEIASGGRTVHITGELTPTAEMRARPNPMMIPVTVTQERQRKLDLRPGEVSVAVSLPGSAVLPLPAATADCSREIVLELHNAVGQSWQQPLTGAKYLPYQGKNYAITATQKPDGIHVDITPTNVQLTSHQ